MSLLRSALVGIGAAFASIVLVLLGAMVAVTVIPRPQGTSFSIDPISAVRTSPFLWIVGLVAFLWGFLSEQRRGKFRKPRSEEFPSPTSDTGGEEPH
jgi:hypothetical protein